MRMWCIKKKQIIKSSVRSSGFHSSSFQNDNRESNRSKRGFKEMRRSRRWIKKTAERRACENVVNEEWRGEMVVSTCIAWHNLYMLFDQTLKSTNKFIEYARVCCVRLRSNTVLKLSFGHQPTDEKKEKKEISENSVACTFLSRLFVRSFCIPFVRVCLLQSDNNQVHMLIEI